MRVGNTITVQSFYDRLRNAYLSNENSNDAKMWQFRLVMEDYMNYLVAPDSPNEKLQFKQAQEIWLEQTKNYRLDHEITFVRKAMNNVVHGNKSGTPDRDLKVYFDSCVLIINLISGEMPDKATLAAFGKVDQNYLEELNPQQRDIILDTARIVYVNAGPGTGKTHLLVYKMLDTLVREKEKAKIVSMSFTRSSAASLSEKLAAESMRRNVTKYYLAYSGTIHSYSLNSIKQYLSTKGRPFEYLIADDSEFEDIVDDIFFTLEEKYDKEVIREFLKKPDEAENEELKQMIEEKKSLYKRISVGEILDLYYKMLNEDEEFAQWTTDNMNYLLVDEAQDLTMENYRIFDLLLTRNPNLRLFLVGDPRQNIFGFLGGSYKYLDEFLSKYKEELSQKDLTLSYRCPQKILDFTNGLSFSDCRNPQLKSNVKQEGTIEVKSYGDEYAEAEAIVEFIKTLPDPNGIAVLFPRLRPLAKIVDKLNEEHIAFRVLGGGRIIKPHIAVFSYMCKIVETDGRSLGAANNLCGRLEMPKCRTMKEFFATGIGREIARLNKAYQSKNISYLELARSFVILCRRYIQDGDKTEQNADFKKLYDAVIKKTDSPKGYARSFKYYRNAFSSLEVEFKSEAESKDAITISTIHSAKGLEWDTVIIPELTESGFKNGRANEEVSPEEREEAANTDLKLLYVAVTRAKDRLLMTYPNYLADSRAETKPLRMIRSIILSV